MGSGELGLGSHPADPSWLILQRNTLCSTQRVSPENSGCAVSRLTIAVPEDFALTAEGPETYFHLLPPNPDRVLFVSLTEADGADESSLRVRWNAAGVELHRGVAVAKRLRGTDPTDRSWRWL